MDLKTAALAMYPYWILGAAVVAATYFSGHREVVRIEKKGIVRWIRFLAFLTIFRIIVFKMFPEHTSGPAKNILMIPWPLTLTVFWEDACHGLPLYLIRKILGTKWYMWPVHALLMAMVMFEFGLGHVYQGVPAACLLSLYIPVSIHLGKKYGFGTVMLGHTLFDLTTILTLKAIVGG